MQEAGDTSDEAVTSIHFHDVLCKRYWQSPYLAEVQKDRVVILVDAKVTDVHVGLSEDQRLIDDYNRFR